MCINPRKLIINKEEVIVKCGKCEICQKKKQSAWAIKLQKESLYHLKSCFITLTFDNKILLDKNNKYGADPSFLYHIDNSKEYFQKFIKRLRKKYKEKSITYFHVAEYGEKTKRPHHHAILYGINFEEDRFEMEKSKTGKTQFFSKTLYDLWGAGRISIQDLNNYNSAYIAQYSVKKSETNDNKRYKPKMTFSNRNKMSQRYIRRNYNTIINGYIEDSENKKYSIPSSYLNTLKNSEKEKHKFAYLQYEQKLMERLSNINQNEYLENLKTKNEKIKIRNQKKIRDF